MSHEQQIETLTLLRILAMGSRDIEQERFRNAELIFAELDAADRAPSDD